MDQSVAIGGSGTPAAQHRSVLNLPRVIVDFETFSELDVTDVGAWRYAEHPSTEILCMSYRLPDQKTQSWYPGIPFPPDLIKHVDAGFPVEAHNAQFERAIWFNLVHKAMGHPMPTRFIDTMATCAYRGLPLGLDNVGGVLNLPIKKNPRGKYLLGRLSKPRKPTKNDSSLRCNDWALLEELYGYCDQDVNSEYVLGETLGDLPQGEYGIWCLDQRINTRGVLIDVESVYAAKKIIIEVTTRLEKEMVTLTDGKITTGNQVARIREWCNEQGFFLPDLTADMVEVALKDEKIRLYPEVKRILELRQQLSLASIKKIDKFIDCVCDDGTMRGLLQYHGAGTGRWAGRLVQPQNFPRGTLIFPKDSAVGDLKKKDPGEFMELLIAAIKPGSPDLLELLFGEPLAAISSALRGMFIARPGKLFYVADFSAIEARVVMWVAEQSNGVEAFQKFDRKEGPDIYCVFAGSIYERNITKENGEERQLGKIGVLGCGYQMAGPKLQIQAEQDYKVVMDLSTANMIVDKYRNTYPEIVNLWRGLEDAAIYAVKRHTYTRFKKIGFEFVSDKAGDWLTMILPSGRRLWYFRPMVKEAVIHYVDKITGENRSFTKDQLTYEGRDNKKGGRWARTPTYGGMLTENCVQAISRDLMVAAMVRSEAKGYPLVLTVHDELVSEKDIGTGDLHEFEALTAGPNPPWADGLPVAAEAWCGPRYRK